MSMLTDRENRKLLLWVVLPVVLVAFLWSFATNSDVLRAIKLAITLGGLSLAWIALRQLKNEQVKSGLNEDEYLLKQAGGATQLMIEAVTVRGIGRFFIVLPSILTLIAAITIKSMFFTITIAVATGFLCIPYAVFCLRSAKKSRRAAERAGAKNW